MNGFIILSVFSLTTSITCNYIPIEPTRIKRGIFGTVTSTVFKTVTEHHYVPATCVHVEPNLPDCRNVRFLNWPSFSGLNTFSLNNSIATPPENGNSSETLEVTNRTDYNNRQKETVHIQGWAEYLGFDRPTVTVTEVKITPTTVLDSRIVVTYAIKGCKPHHIPEDLKRCPEDEIEEFEVIVPTKTVHSNMESTKIFGESVMTSQGELQGGEAEEMDELALNKRATKSLR